MVYPRTGRLFRGLNRVQRRVNISTLTDTGKSASLRPVLAHSKSSRPSPHISSLFSSSRLLVVLSFSFSIPLSTPKFTMSSGNAQAPLPFGYQFVAGAVAGVSEVSGLI